MSTSSIYVAELKNLQSAVIDLMEKWPSGPSFYPAKIQAEIIAPLVAGQIQELEGARTKLNKADPAALRKAVQEFSDLLGDDTSKRKFAEFGAMLDTLSNKGAA